MVMRSLKGFLREYSTISTKRAYRGSVYFYLDFIVNGVTRTGKGRITPEIESGYEKLAEQYFAGGRDYADDFVAFLDHCKEIGYAPKYCNVLESGVREFLIFNDVDFTLKEGRRIRKHRVKGGTT
jgi:hypothetical protein